MIPTEIWLEIVDILGLQGYTRACTNLINVLGLSESLVYKYLVTELFKNRSEWGNYDIDKNYNQQMIDFWERTGIDDGVPKDYLISHLNSSTKMYKTIWAHHVFKTKNGGYKVFEYTLFDYLMNSYIYKEKYTYSIFKDCRPKSNGITGWKDLTTNSRKKIEDYFNHLDNCKKITYDKTGYTLYDRKNRRVLCKVYGSLI